jgi:hypothetical protein
MANLLQMLKDVPPMLIAAWTVWFVAGGMLAMWYRRASLEADFAPAAAAPRPAVRSRAISRSAEASVPAVVFDEPVFGGPPVDEPPAPVRDKRDARPIVAGDPFGELATLLDQPSPAAHRPSGDSPILNSAGHRSRTD